VLVGHVPEQQAARVQVGDEVLVGLLEELAADEGYVRLEGAVGAYGDDDLDAVGPGHPEVVLTEGRQVHHAGAVLGGHIGVVDDEVRARDVDQLERALVAPAVHLRAREVPAGGVPALAEGLLQQRLGHDDLVGAVGGDHVGDVRVHGHREVGDQGPGRGRPDHQGRLARQRA
jgi:hypothetical protein